MEIRFQAGGITHWSAQALLSFVFNESPGNNIRESIEKNDPRLLDAAPWIDIAPALYDFKSGKSEVCVLYGLADLPIPRVLLAGLGKRTHFACEAMYLENLRNVAGAAAKRCRDLGIDSIAFSVPGLQHLVTPLSPLSRIVEEIVFGTEQGLYRYTALKTRNPADPPLPQDPQWMALLFEEEQPCEELCRAAHRGETVARAVSLTRNLGNGPANAITPSFLADEAGKLARRRDMTCEVFRRSDLEEMGMGAFLAVAAGAVQEPRLVVLDYTPEGHADDKPLIVIGKGLTFDSGGISLKAAAGMREMKADMAGAAAVLGLFDALGALEVPRRVIGLLPCTENMPGGNATHPGDVVRTFSGKTVEIVNTDAEGRLVLCDVLSYAQKRWQADAIVDIATLTGACVVALGKDVAGLFSRDPLLTERIRGLGQTVGDLFWPLPMWERYFENLKSDTADMTNSGIREGGACTAAAFLKQFVDDKTRWAHLDIAGPAFASTSTTDRVAGATGFGVRTLVELALYGLPAA